MAAEPRVSKRARSVPTRFVAETPAAKKPRAAATAPSKAKKQAKAAPTKAAGAKGATKPSQKKTPATKAKAKSTRAAEPAKAKKEKSKPAPKAKQAKPPAAKKAIKAPPAPAALAAPAAPPAPAASAVDASLVNGLAVGDTAVMPSSSGGGGYFIKRLPNSKWSCSCPDFKFNKRKRGLECKHIHAVRADIPPQAIIKAAPAPIKSAGKKKSAPQKRKRDNDDDDDDDDEACTPLEEAAAKYGKLTIKKLKVHLRHNVQQLGGVKDELVERCADLELYGCLPRCPECGGGRLKVTYTTKEHGGQGLFKCPGFYDDDHYHYCNYSSWHEERKPWSLAPAEEVDCA